MIAPIESATIAAVRLALDAATLRQQAISANIANHASEGWAPQAVDFEAQLGQAAETFRRQGQVTSESLRGVQPQLVPLLDENGSPAVVHIDEQMQQMAANAVHYQALTRALGRHFSLLSVAVNDGRR